MNIKELFQRMTMGRAFIIGIMLAIIYYFLVLDKGMTQQNAIKASETQIVQLQKEMQENQAKLDRAMIYKKTAAEIGTTINKLLAVIPEHFTISDLEKIVSNEAKIAGSSLIGITPGTAEEVSISKEFDLLMVHLDMAGSFLQHMVFLSDLTKITQILIVRKFDLQLLREARGDETPSVHLQADIVAYRYKGPSAATPATPPAGAPPPLPQDDTGKPNGK